MATAAPLPRAAPQARARSLGPAAWALIGITAGAAALRFSTLGVQSFWHDEAVTVGRVLHPSLGGTLKEIPSSEAAPPLYYVLAWLWTKVFGISEAGIRSLSALFGTATVPVAYAIGARLVSRRAALLAAGAVAVSPLLVWYSQEARAYALLVLTSALTIWFFACALREPERRRWLWWWAAAASLALSTHYFAGFVVAPEAAWLLWSARGRRRPVLAAIAVPAAVAAALLPLAIHQAGRGHDRWIAAISFGTRATTAVKQFVQGVGGTPSVALSVVIAACALAGAALAAFRTTAEERRGALVALSIAAAAVGLPVLLAILGKDYVIARNLIVVWVPLAVVAAAGWGASRAGAIGLVAAAGFFAASLAIVIAVDHESRLQRPDWRSAAKVIGPAPVERALVVPFIGDDPLAYYLPDARVVRHGTVRASEVDVVGWALRRSRTPPPPAAGFRLVSRRHSGKLTFLRYTSSRPATFTRVQLSAERLGKEHGSVLVQSP